MEISELARKRRREEETKWSRRGALRLFAAPSVCLFLTWFICGHAQAADKVTYVDHVQPIFDNHCASCHNPDDKKGDLDLTSYSGMMAGSSTGEVVESDYHDETGVTSAWLSNGVRVHHRYMDEHLFRRVNLRRERTHGTHGST